MSKHAFLIEAHNNIEQLKKLLHCLDYEDNDVFLHIDSKSNVLDGIENYHFEKAGYFIVPSVDVNWGGFSQIEAELRLLQASTQVDHYARYHLISGLDLPLVPQRVMHDYFDSMPNTEFVHFDYQYPKDLFLNRMGLYHLLQDRIDRSQKLLIALEKIILGVQKTIGINRIGKLSIDLGKGANWFSITDAFARYSLERKPWIERTFRYTKCCDEVFLQTILINSPFKENRFFDKREGRYGNTRAVDWKRGNPYVFHKEDYEWLITSGYMFGRKFDVNIDSEVVDLIVNYVTSEGKNRIKKN